MICLDDFQAQTWENVCFQSKDFCNNSYAVEQLFNQIGNCLTKIEEIAYFAYQSQSKLTHYISNILFLLIRTKNIHKNAYVVDFGHNIKTSRKFSASVSIF